MEFVNELKHKFKTGNIIIKLLFINIAVFLLDVVFDLVGLGGIMEYLKVSSEPLSFIIRAWALVTFQFMHGGVMHILFNMLWLYWFGEMFLQYFSQKQLLATYLLGGFAGAGVFFILYNVVPSFRAGEAVLVGASASVSAIAVAIAAYRPDFKLNLMFLGPVKIKYLVAVMLIMDVISIKDGSNVGGHFSHFGGAALGLFFGLEMKKGNDVTKGFNMFLDWIFSYVKPRKNKLKVTYSAKKSSRVADYEYNANKKVSQAEIDVILEKISRSGYDSLSKDEREKLFRASK